MPVMAHINLYLYNPHQVSASYLSASIDASVNADAQCGQGLSHYLLGHTFKTWTVKKKFFTIQISKTLDVFLIFVSGRASTFLPQKYVFQSTLSFLLLLSQIPSFCVCPSKEADKLVPRKQVKYEMKQMEYLG